MKKFILCFVLFLTVACSDSLSLKGQDFALENAPDVTLGFAAEDMRYFGQGYVNRYFGQYQQNGYELKFLPAASTMMAGPIEQMNLESAYFKQLAEVKSFAWQDGKLVLHLSDGNELVWVKSVGN